MAEYDKDTLTAPVYRYYTVDLLTNEVLAEIPFGGVSYERAIKSAGAFSGKIPVLPTPASRSWDLYKSTLPGKTGLYIMRNDDCVWGGMIWSRTYDIISRQLSVEASEFPSYFHHRRIWKTWSHQYGATVVASGGTAQVTFDNGTSIALKSGASVRFDFDDPNAPMGWLAYNGYYTIADTPLPTDSQFTISGSVSTAQLSAVDRTNNVVTFYTKGAHGFSTGNIISVNVAVGPMQFNGTYSITATSGASSSFFTINLPGDPLPKRTITYGTATRPLPDGTYTNVTVSVRTDTYSYIRALVEQVFQDFNGIGFIDQYVQPAEVTPLSVTNKVSTAGYATITTKTDHGLIPGQAIDIKNVGPEFDGSPVVVDTPHTNQFRFKTGGEVPSTDMSVRSALINGRMVQNGVVTMYTVGNHGFNAGDWVSVQAGADPDGRAALLNGDFVISRIPASNQFQYTVLGNSNIDYMDLAQPTATANGVTQNLILRGIASNTMVFGTDGPIKFNPGNSVTISNVNMQCSIIDKSYDYTTNNAIMVTQDPHFLSVGDSVTTNGIQDVLGVTTKTIGNKTVTLQTTPAHHIKKGDQIDVANIRDGYTVTSRSISSGTLKLNLDTTHNVVSGDNIKIADVYEQNDVQRGSIAQNVCTLTISSGHLIKPNMKVTVSGVDESFRVVSKHLSKKEVKLTTSREHNFKVGQDINITGCGTPFDGKFKITDVTDTTIKYKVKSTGSLKTTSVSNGAAQGDSPIFNHTFVVSTVSGNTIRFPVTAKTVNAIAKTGTIRYLAPYNGENLTVSATTSTSVSVATSLGDQSQVNILPPKKKDDPNPRISANSVANGHFTVSSVTRDTITYSITRNTPRQYTSKSPTPGSAVIASSIFNGTWGITAVTDNTFTFKFAKALDYNIKETPINTPAYGKSPTVFGGTYTIANVDYTRNTFAINKTHGDIGIIPISGYGYSSVSPLVYAATYGPYPENSDLDIVFSTQDYSGDNVTPVEYRGDALQNVGDALDAYSDAVNGFEYRIDCDYDPDRDAFTRTFVLIPIVFPDPPEPGEVSNPERFGADRIVFEYPGNITTLSIAESAENSSTRFFATGQNQISSDGGTTVSVAAATDLLYGPKGGRWPILDDDHKIDNIDDKDVLYSYAQRYLTEGRPPGVTLTMSVNGSLSPQVGYYAPGDWCSLIVNDEFIQQRLQSDLEPRDDILVRKIQSFKVTVPDGSTVPEKVELTLVRETAVDSIGQ